MSRVIRRRQVEPVELNDHVANFNKNNGSIHLAIGSAARLRVLKGSFWFPNKFNSNTIFCKHNSSYCASSSSGLRHTENPSQATCSECLSVATSWGYGEYHNSKGSTHFRLSKKSISKITNWIPDNCNIIISSSGIKVSDSLTDEDFDVKTIDEASIIIAEKCFKELSPEFIHKNDKYLTNDIYDFNDNKYSVQGLNFDKKTKTINGLILSSKKNSLVSLSFKEIFQSGYHLGDGTPCGEYLEKRSRMVESEIYDSLGIGMEIDLI